MVDEYYQRHKDDPMWREQKRARDNAFKERKGKSNKDGVRIPDSVLLRRAFKTYGAKCSCCGEGEKLFLTIARKDGGKLDLASAVKEPSHIKYETLCFNCMMGRARTGSVCPHKLNDVIWEDKDHKVVSKVGPNSLDKWSEVEP